MNNLVNDFLIRMDGKVDDATLSIISKELNIVCGDYEIKKRETAIVPFEGLPEAYKAYMVTCKIGGLSDTTLYQYRLRLEKMLTTMRKPISKITSNDIWIYLYSLQEQNGLSNRSLNNVRQIINAFFKWCNQEGYCDTNPCAKIHAIKYELKPRKALSDTQLENLRNGCRNVRDKAIVEVLYSTGCRVSELAGLKKSDINFTTREVQLFGKGKKHRVSYISAKADVALKEYFATRDDDNDAVFVGMRKPHNGLGIREFENILHDIGSRANIENVYPHKMRHTFATNALEHGMPVTNLQKLLGHSKIDTTLIYAEVSQTDVAYSHKKYVS